MGKILSLSMFRLKNASVSRYQLKGNHKTLCVSLSKASYSH